MSDKEQYQEEGKYNICRAIRSGITDNQTFARQCDATVEEVISIRTAFDL